MHQKIDLGSNFVDHFPVFDSDGYTKKAGETAFTITNWLDGVETSIVSTIAEIDSTGEYRLTLEPTAEGEWSTEVLIDYNKSIWVAEYVVQKAVVKFCMTAADDNITARFALWVERYGERLTDFESMSATLKSTDGTVIEVLMIDTADNADGVFTFSLASSAIAPGYEYYLDVTATRQSLSWSNNIGFAKVV